MDCRVCLSPTRPFGGAKVLGRYDVQYFQCESCGCIQTEEPYWLEEAYPQAITASDLGLVSRNIGLATLSRAIVLTFFDTGGRFVDYGGGYGLLVRLMRDSGLDFLRYDKRCPNLFAAGFDADPADGQRYELLTAFEVFEHLTHPIAELERMLKLSKNILFTTTLVPPHAPEPNAWWYYSPDHGQHVTFYTRKGLALLAQRFGLCLCSDGISFHLFSEKRITELLFLLVSRAKIAKLLVTLKRRPSLLPADYFKITGKPLG